MKKILWLIFFILFIPQVEAKVYYSLYSDYSDFQEEEIIPTDTIEVIKEARYLWYKNVSKLGDYKLFNELDNFSDDCYLSEYSDWSSEKLDNIGYIYEQRNKYNYTMAKGIRYIYLYDLQGSYGSFRIPELEITYKDKSINYTYTCNGCLDGFDDYIHNGIYAENKSYISNGGSLIIDLGKEYPIHLIDVIFYIFDLGETDKLYTIGYSTDKKNLLYSKQYKLKFSDENWVNAVKRIHNVDEINKSLWQYNESSTGLKNNDFVINKEVYLEYRYQEKWCKAYEITKEYSNYSKEQLDDYPNKLESSLKYFYSYRTRDKLELEINDITTNNFDLNSFVLNSTDEVKITNNIDWNKNGVYDIAFQVNDLTVNEKVKLNIESNTIDELNQIISNLKKEYENKIKGLEQLLNNCKLDKDCLNKKIIELTEKYENEISNLNNQILNYQAEIKNLENANKVYLDKIKELEQDVKDLNKGISSLTINKENEIKELSKYINDYKMPNFILKIGFLDSKFIIIIFLLLLYIMYLVGKKSNKK